MATCLSPTAHLSQTATNLSMNMEKLNPMIGYDHISMRAFGAFGITTSLLAIGIALQPYKDKPPFRLIPSSPTIITR